MTPARLLAALLLALCAAPAARAETYPDRPVRIIIGFPAGGPTDVPGRIIAEKLRAKLGQPVVVENRSGAGGRIATEYVLTQPRDGHTLLLCTYIDAINVLSPRPGYQLRDLAPISQITRAFYAVAISNAVPAADLRGFLAYAKARPGDVAYGHVGVASAPNLIAREFEHLTGVQMLGVPYRGTPDALQDLLAGRLGFFVGPLVSTMPLARSGQLRVIGMTSAERLSVAPDIPTLSEQGVPLVSFGWLGLCTGAGTPPAIIARLNGLVVEAVASPEYRSVVEGTGAEAVSSAPEALGALMEATRAQADETGRRFGIRFD